MTIFAFIMYLQYLQFSLSFVIDFNTNLVIVKDGIISPLLQRPQFSEVWPTIRADINDLELKFVSPKRVSVCIHHFSSKGRLKFSKDRAAWNGKTDWETFVICSFKLPRLLKNVLLLCHAYDEDRRDLLNSIDAILRPHRLTNPSMKIYCKFSCMATKSDPSI